MLKMTQNLVHFVQMASTVGLVPKDNIVWTRQNQLRATTDRKMIAIIRRALFAEEELTLLSLPKMAMN